MVEKPRHIRYTQSMTISERNVFFKAGIAFSCVVALLAVAASFLIIPVYTGAENGLFPGLHENTLRPGNFSQIVTGRLLERDYYAVHASVALAVLFSLFGMIFIYSFFERTSAPEILYISFFVISFSFEIFRFVLPLNFVYNFSLFYLLGSSRILLFARYFGVFSLFLASVRAAGLEAQKTRNIIMILIIAVLLFTIGIPVDIQTWDTSYYSASGYSLMFKMIEAAIFLAMILTFFVAAKVRDSSDYIHVGIGVLFAIAGRNTLIGTDNWVGPVMGIFLLSFGIWYVCSKLHRIHLWL